MSVADVPVPPGQNRIDAAEVCARLGVTRHQLGRLQLMFGFPSPLWTVAGRYWWNRRDLEAWVNRHPAGRNVRRRPAR